MFHIQLAAWEQVLRRFVKQETQGTKIDVSCRVVADVEKLHVAAVVDAEFQALRHIVDLGRNYGVWLVEVELGKHLKQGSSFVELLGCLCVDAIDLKHRLKCADLICDLVLNSVDGIDGKLIVGLCL